MSVKDCPNVHSTNTYKGAATPVSVQFLMTLGTQSTTTVANRMTSDDLTVANNHKL